MNRIQNRVCALFLILALAVLPAGCGQTADTPSSPSGTQQSALSAAVAASYSAEDSDASWDASTAVAITLNGASAEAAGAGVSIKDSIITITAAGTYVISGTLENGQIRINAGKEDTVRLVLNGAEISCADSAAIYAEQAKKTILILQEGAENMVTDGSSYTYAAGEDEPDAAIFAKDSLTITGAGALSVTGNFKNGVGSRDDLVITGGNLTVTAANDGLRGRDSVAVSGGTLQIRAAADGIQSNHDGDPEKGWISLDGGSFQITAGNDGIQAETSLSVTGGDFSIVSGGGSAQAPAKQRQNGGNPGSGGKGTPPEGGMPANGMPANGMPSEGAEPPDGTMPAHVGMNQAGSPEPVSQTGPVSQSSSGEAGTTAQDAAASESRKGLKAGTMLTVSGGSFTIDSADDAVHGNGDMAITDGSFTIATGDDGFHADGILQIGGGTILITESCEGLEGTQVTVSGGDIRLTASDDGVNAAGGSDGTSAEDTFQSTAEACIRITGGFLLVNASGDGLDSNGNLYLQGGTVLVNGPTSGGDGALDYDGECTVSGGVFIAAGSSGMAQSPGEGSTQNTLSVYFTRTQTAGTLISLSDSGGNPILSFAPSKEFQNLVISTPDFKLGESCLVSSGGTSTGGDAGYYARQAVQGASQLAEVTLSSTVTAISDDGSAVIANARGGPGGHGGAGHGSGKAPGNRTREPG